MIPTHSKLLAGICACAALMAGCHSVPGSNVSTSRASFLMGPGDETVAPASVTGRTSQRGILTVNFAKALGMDSARQRRVLATLADVERVVVTVKTADNATVSQTVEQAAITAGQTTLSFSNLAPGVATVTVEAFDGADKTLGFTTKSATVAVGAATTVDVLVSLLPTLTSVTPTGDGGSSTPNTGGLMANITLLDGLVGVGPIPAGTAGPTDFAFAPDGNLWVLTNTGSTLMKFDGDGHQLGTYPMYTVSMTSDLNIGPDGTMVVSNSWGDIAITVKPVGAKGEWDSTPMEGNPVFEANGDCHYVGAHSNMLFTKRADGTISAGIALPFVGSLLKRNPTGGFWVTSCTYFKEPARIVRVLANGTVSPAYSMPGYAKRLQVDAEGNAWVSDSQTSQVYRFAPDGTMSTPIAARGNVHVDAQGRLWMRERTRLVRYDSNGAPVVAYGLPDDDGGFWSDVRFDSQGRAWVSDSNHGTLIRLTLP